MNWYKRAAVDNFSGSPKTLEEAQQRYREGSEMVRYHVVYDLSKMGDWELVEYAAENDPSKLVRNMAISLLRNKE